MNKISIIVPCYNEEESLPMFYQETQKAVSSITDTDYEFLFVDDGSSDHTLAAMRLLAYKDDRCRYFSFSRNFGKEAAMYAGLCEAEGDFCVIMDADLQHPPSLLPAMYQAVTEENYDCCGGKRIDRDGEGSIRNFLSRSFYGVIKKLTHMEMGDGFGDFRMMNRTMVDAILQMKEYNRYLKGVFSFVGFDTKWIEFHNVERVCGKTKWNIKSLFSYALLGIVSFSTAPLKLAGIIGILLMAVSAGLGVFCLAQPLFFHQSVKSIYIILLVVTFLSSLQMIFTYIIGEYLSKDYLENKNRPIYIIKESSNQLDG